MSCNLRVLSLGLLIVAFIAACRLSVHYRTELKDAQKAATDAQAITRNTITAITLFNDIARATHADKQRANAESVRRIVYIKEAVKDDACAARPVPRAAADKLRQHRNKIRTAGADPR